MKYKKNKDVFRDFFKKVKPIRLKEPLAETLGAFKEKDAVIEYTFSDVVKMAGHACPTIASAYVCCQKALEKLYPNEIPVRGNISITIYGEADEGVYGVIGQLFSFITGAAAITGFHGIGHKFKRKDLLKFTPEKIGIDALQFKFRRLDNNKAVLVSLYLQNVPFPEEKSRRLGQLLEKVIWEAAKEKDIKEFQDLWIEKVKNIVLMKNGINRWLKIEEIKNECNKNN